MVRVIGIDIGSRNILMGEWVPDRYQISKDGVPSLLNNDSGKSSSR